MTQFQLAIQDSNDFHFYFHGSEIFDTASGKSTNEWYHIAITKSSNYIRGFIDGVMKSYVYNTSSTTLNGFSIGDQRSSGSHPTYGYISNLRLVAGSIPTTYQTSETSTGTTVFTPPTSPLTTSSQGATASDVKVLTCQSNRFIDNSNDNQAITVGGNARVHEDIPFEYLQRQTKLITCQENRFKDIIDYRHSVTPTGSGAKVSTLSPFSSNASYKTANTGAIYMDGTSFATVDDQAQSFTFGTEDFTI